MAVNYARQTQVYLYNSLYKQKYIYLYTVLILHLIIMIVTAAAANAMTLWLSHTIRRKDDSKKKKSCTREHVFMVALSISSWYDVTVYVVLDNEDRFEYALLCRYFLVYLFACVPSLFVRERVICCFFCFHIHYLNYDDCKHFKCTHHFAHE